MELKSTIEDVFREMHEPLWRALLGFTGSPLMASDAASEAFAQAIARGNKIRDPRAWIWASAFRIGAGMLAKQSNERRRETVSMEVVEDVPVIHLVEMLGDLSQQQRSVVILRYVGNFKPKEIAELLNTTWHVVKVGPIWGQVTLRSAVCCR